MAKRASRAKFTRVTALLVAVLVSAALPGEPRNGHLQAVDLPASGADHDHTAVRVSGDGVVTTSHGVAIDSSLDSRSVAVAPNARAAGGPSMSAAAAAGPFAGFAARATGGGYWIATSSGSVSPYAGAQFFGDVGGRPLNAAIVGIASTASGNGYWLVAADGGIFSFGDAAFYGSMGNKRLNRPVIGMSATASGNGYWLFASDGGIFTFGDAAFRGSTGDLRLRKPIVGMTPAPSGSGYWLVASDGGVFSFNVPFLGSAGNLTLNAPVVGALRAPSGTGYWLVAADGGIFAFGDAPFYGSTGSFPYMPSVVGLSARAAGQPGYIVVGAGGATWEFGPGLSPQPPSGACAMPAPTKPSSHGGYAFGGLKSDGSPLRWSACAPIPWVLSTPDAPAGALGVLQTAFAKAAQQTGLNFVYAGSTTARAGEWIDGTWSAGGAWKPIIVDFQPLGGPHLCGSAGCGWHAQYDGQIVSAAIILNRTMPAGWTPSAMMGPVALHEIGHVIGLNHAPDASQVMNATIMQAFTDYQLGDRNGLFLVGTGSVTLAKRAGP